VPPFVVAHTFYASQMVRETWISEGCYLSNEYKGIFRAVDDCGKKDLSKGC